MDADADLGLGCAATARAERLGLEINEGHKPLVGILDYLFSML